MRWCLTRTSGFPLPCLHRTLDRLQCLLDAQYGLHALKLQARSNRAKAVL